MKNKFSVMIAFLAIITMSLTGCSKYEKDESYTTDLYGSYSKDIEAFVSDEVNQITEETKYSYYLFEKYEFNTDDTYKYTVKEIIYNDTTKDNSANGKILSVEEISNDITQITLDQEIKELSTGETSNQVIYQYKNVLGTLYKTEVPKGKTFELHLNDYIWFDKKGQYHLCGGSGNCDCSESCPKYIRKNNIVYFQSMDEAHRDCYTIKAYIVNDGLFFPELYKTK